MIPNLELYDFDIYWSKELIFIQIRNNLIFIKYHHCLIYALCALEAVNDSKVLTSCTYIHLRDDVFFYRKVVFFAMSVRKKRSNFQNTTAFLSVIIQILIDF